MVILYQGGWVPRILNTLDAPRLFDLMSNTVVDFSVYNFERNTDTSIPIYVNHRGFVRFYSPEVRTTFCPIDVK